jgi:hypothetical protein
VAWPGLLPLLTLEPAWPSLRGAWPRLHSLLHKTFSQKANSPHIIKSKWDEIW